MAGSYKHCNEPLSSIKENLTSCVTVSFSKRTLHVVS
jgi:hypothetical protein